VKLHALVVAAILPIASHLSAATICVATADDLTAALLAAQASLNADNEIRIRAGHYDAPDGGWHVDIQQTGISIAGGYSDANCQTDTLDATLTVLDGDQSVRPLTIDTTFQNLQQPVGKIVIRGMTIQNGSGDRVGGLKISDAGPIYVGDILVERNIFRDNVATVYEAANSAGALLAATDGTTFDHGIHLVVRDNVFAHNQANDAAAAALFSNNTIVVNNNTITDNQPTDTSLAIRTTVGTFTSSTVIYDNNIFWANNPGTLTQTYDLRADDPLDADVHAMLFNNDLQAVFGTPGAEQGRKNLDPFFKNRANGDFRLAAGSPLIDKGIDSPSGGAGTFDVGGSARLQGLHVDMGAYESNMDFIFEDGFDAPTVP
jgi:hypothetical protein